MDYPKMIYLHGSKKGTRVNSIEEEETLLGVTSSPVPEPEPIEPQQENEEPVEEEIELPKEEHHHKTKTVKKVKKGKK